MPEKKPKKPVSVTLDSDVLEALQHLIRQGEAPSVSSLVNDALRHRLERRQQAERVRAYLEENLLGGQALTEEELVEARGMLAANKARTAARRGSGASAA
ncbi:ribbon-helix-helix domain-containing protein [Streptomyces sp. TRM 70361]|uniref:ribbon-helix-helix domain-containing protein n=1 Tax=Streptomyces sp. TRM 70361 TaxID=3116553 RepID=UPI002E7B49BD|nr:ribbon-helix-helix domain-containing protein [Streptomyces sp. TRM 70361]MEE1940607.1 ribbon-helix-helix domain-containing protein [Streptomyces sp. TRM 70361]